jgi:hypothetical protein
MEMTMLDNYMYNKDDIDSWLKKRNVKNYTIHDDLSVSGFNLMLENYKLTHLPFKLKSFKKLFLANNHFSESTLPSLPEDLEDLNIENNHFKSLPVLPLNLKRLFIKNNAISHLESLPQSLIILNAESTNLTDLPKLPDTLKQLNINNNKFTKLPPLPKELEVLHCANNNLTTLTHLPQELTDLSCASNKLSSLILPSKLEKLHCNNNHLNELVLPNKLQILYCNKNELTILNLPNSVKVLSLEANNLMSFNIPLDLERLSLYTSQVQYITYLPEKIRYLAVGVECLHQLSLNEWTQFLSLVVDKNYLEGIAIPNIDKKFKTLIKINGKEQVKNYLSKLLAHLEAEKLEVLIHKNEGLKKERKKI